MIELKKKKGLHLDPQHILTKHHLPYGLDFGAGSLFLINKPLEWTSFDVVNKIKYAIKYHTPYPNVKVGHAGTLDPMADGLLIVCTGKYTKLLETLGSTYKSYHATMKIGVTTPSYDRECAEENVTDFQHITTAQLEDARQKYSGIFDQIPPIYSAIKVKGQTAYKLARRGQDIEIKSRQVEVTSFEYTDISLPFVSLDINVSKGTYIRSLAHDVGQYIGVGAYLYRLTRTSIDQYLLEDALEVDQCVDYIKQSVANNNIGLPE